MNSSCIGRVIAIITVVATIAVLGIGIWLFGTTALVALVTENSLCCLLAIAALVGVGFLFYTMRNVFSRD